MIEFPGLVVLDGLAHFASTGGAVLLQLPLAVGPAGLSLGEDPGPATFHLDLGEAGAASESGVSEPLGEPLLASGEAGVMLGVGNRRPQVQGVDPAAAHDPASGSRAAVTPGA